MSNLPPELPELPKKGVVPGQTGLPSLPKAPSLPKVPGALPPLPGTQAGSGVPSLPATPAQPVLPTAPALPQMQPPPPPVSPIVTPTVVNEPIFQQPIQEQPIQNVPQPQYQQSQPVQPQYQEQPVQEQEYVQPQYQEQQFAQPQVQNRFNNSGAGFNSSSSNTEETIEVETKRFNKSKKSSNKTKPSSKEKGSFFKKKEDSDEVRSPYAGRRKNVLIARVVSFSVVGLLVIAGVNSLIPKSTSLNDGTREEIMSAVKYELNWSSFPRVTGEGVALGFTQSYLSNYSDPAQEDRRKANLNQYVSEKVLNSIVPTLPNADELVALGIAGDKASAEAIINNRPQQIVTNGPFLLNMEMFAGGNAALYTVTAEINNSSWLTMEVPLYYDDATDKVSVSASPTFIQNLSPADVPAWENNVPWTDDTEVEKEISDDVKNYMQAWFKSDTANIERFLVKEDGEIVSTREAIQGLNNSVTLLGVSNISVESITVEDSEDRAQVEASNTRRVEVTVRSMEPVTNLVYVQKYWLTIKFVNNNWFVEDIQNSSTLIDRNVTMEKEAEKSNQ